MKRKALSGHRIVSPAPLRDSVVNSPARELGLDNHDDNSTQVNPSPVLLRSELRDSTQISSGSSLDKPAVQTTNSGDSNHLTTSRSGSEVPLWCPLALRDPDDSDGPPECTDPFPNNPTPELLDLLKQEPRRIDYAKEHLYDMAQMTHTSRLCARIRYELKLQYWAELGYPISLDYHELVSRVRKLRYELVEDVIMLGSHSFMFRQLKARVEEHENDPDRRKKYKFQLEHLNKDVCSAQWNDHIIDLCAPG